MLYGSQQSDCGKLTHSEFEIAMINILKDCIVEINDRAANADQQSKKVNFNFFGISDFTSGINEILKLIQRRKSRKQSRAHLTWVIGPRSGVLKARFVGNGFTQITGNCDK